MPMTVFNVE